MLKATDISESEESILITDIYKRISTIPYQSIRMIELNEPSRWGLQGIQWNDINLVFRNLFLASISCIILIPFLIPKSEFIFWLLIYFVVLLGSAFFIFRSQRVGNGLHIISTGGRYSFQIERDSHWEFVYKRLKTYLPSLQSQDDVVLFTTQPNQPLWLLLASIPVIGFMGWSMVNFSLAATLLFSAFGVFTSYLLIKFGLMQGRTEVRASNGYLIFHENRGRYTNLPHQVDFFRLDRLSMNASNQVIIHRKTQKELSAATGLEKFSHFNRIDFHFLRKHYSLVPSQRGKLHRFQVEAINDWIKNQG